ncbi:hypothetical protein FO519_009152, partial [Halicephalobus sp. NKZ332]
NRDSSVPLNSWKCTNIPTTLQILINVRKHFPTMASVVDTLQKSLTQTVLVNLMNNTSESNRNMSGIEMPMIASLAPNNTSLHLEKGKTGQSYINDKPGLSLVTDKNGQNYMRDKSEQILIKEKGFPPEKMDTLVGPLSPAKSEVSSTTETESLRSSTITDHGIGSPGMDKMLKSFKNSKKRVQCDKCLHTFCDKGALKIHNSSVHLREMHMCTIPGCNKQFPSKRSRNRHSNNPNMHTETGRRRNCRTVVSSMNSSSAKPENLSQSTNPLQPPLPDPQVLGLLQRMFNSGQVQNQNQNQALDLRQNPNLVVQQQQFCFPQGIFQTGSLPNQQTPVDPTPGINVSELLKLVIARNMNFVKS